MIKSVHYHHRSGIPSSDGYSCHGCDVQGSFQDCFSGCFDQGGMCSVMNESVHYPHWPGKSPSRGYCCHGCDKQDSCTVMIEGAHYHHRSGIPPSDEKPHPKDIATTVVTNKYLFKILSLDVQIERTVVQ